MIRCNCADPNPVRHSGCHDRTAPTRTVTFANSDGAMPVHGYAGLSESHDPLDCFIRSDLWHQHVTGGGIALQRHFYVFQLRTADSLPVSHFSRR